MLRWHRCVPRKVTYLLIKRWYNLTYGNKTELTPPTPSTHYTHAHKALTHTEYHPFPSCIPHTPFTIFISPQAGTPDFGDDQMGAKIKTSLDQKLTPKNPMPNFRAVKHSRKD